MNNKTEKKKNKKKNKALFRQRLKKIDKKGIRKRKTYNLEIRMHCEIAFSIFLPLIYSVFYFFPC